MVLGEGNSSTSPPPELCANCSLALLATVPVGKAVALGLVLVVFIVCGVLGNILVILSVACHRHLRSVTHYFIVNLAVADLLLSSAVLPFSLAAELLGRWVFGRMLCNVWTVLDVLCCTASILSLCAISIDRFLAVSRPLQYPMLVTGRRGIAALALLWTLAAAISVGPLLGWREPMPEDEAVCRVNEDPGYALFSALGSFYVPLAVILVMYCRVYVVARRHSLARSGLVRDTTMLRMHRGNASSSMDKQDGERGGGEGGGEGEGAKGQEEEGKRAGRSSLLRLLRFSREQKAAKTLGMVVGCFILCWLPFFLVLPIGSMFPSYHPSETVFKVTFWLGYFNSCLNPIIYPCFSQEFKRAFLSVLRARCLRPPGHPSKPPRSAQLSSCSTTYPPLSDTTETLPTHAHHHPSPLSVTHHAPVGAPLCPSFESPLKACCFGVRGSLSGPCPSSEGISSMPTPLPLSSAHPKTLQVSLGKHQGQAL